MQWDRVDINKLSILVLVFLIAFLFPFTEVPVWGQTTWNVPGDATNTCSMANPSCDTIQGAINAASSGDTVNVSAGSYSENVVLAKSLTLQGAQAGVDACGRVATESIITAAAGILLELQAGSAGSIIDGFTFSGSTSQLASTSGPINDLQILNNRFVGFTGSGVFLNDSGTDITVDQNEIDGSSKIGGGGLFHLDQDNFDGFNFTNNCVIDGTTGTGFFVDGNHNVGVSSNRAPLFSGNFIDNNGTGANLGRFAFEFGSISNNTFSNNIFDGLQGGIQNSLISNNNFDGNGRSGLALTGFGGSGDSTRGAQDNTITQNCFTGNGFTNSGEAVFFSAGQFAGTISTNVLNQNNIFGNAVGAVYGGTETIDAENNWWGSADGPSGDGPGSGDAVDGMGGGGAIDFDPFLTSPVTNAPCFNEVGIDIKPGSDPNSINCNNPKEIITVAILTTDVFDATTVDHTTVTFEGASEWHVNKKTGDPERHEKDADGDGDTDLILHFRLGDTNLTCDSTEAMLTGETFGGETIGGFDNVNMVGN